MKRRLFALLSILIISLFAVVHVGYADSLELTRWNNSIRSVTYGGGQCVAVGPTGSVLTSSDGERGRSRSGGASNSLTGVAYGKDKFVAVGSGGKVFTSSDGAKWANPNSGTTLNLSNVGVLYGNNRFVYYGVYTNKTTVGISLTGGVTWSTTSVTA